MKEQNSLLTRLVGKHDSFLFYITTLITILIVIYGAVFPESLAIGANAIREYITEKYGWFFVAVTALYVFIGLGIGLSKYGDMTLGQKGDKPEFSTTTWIAMLFSCGIGVGYVLWGAAEPLFHFMNTPYDATAGSAEAMPVAIRIATMHWGIHSWMGYSIVGLCIAFPAFRLGRKMTLSISLYGLLGEKVETSVWSKVLDVIGALATVGGLSTALGLGIISLSYGAEIIFGVSIGIAGKILLMCIIIGIYVLSTLLGLKKGMSFLSNANIIIAILWCLFILCMGETNTIMRLMVNTLGSYLGELIPMSFYTDPLAKDSWISNWTIFYWLVVISWAPFVGGFIARISRGRTIREYILGAVLVPSLFSLFWFSVIGGSAIIAEMNQTAPMWEVVSKDVGGGIYTLLSAFPISSFMAVVVFINMILFLVTSADSASFFIAMQMSKGQYEPKTSMKVLWGLFLGLLALVLLVSGGLQALQAATIIVGTPFAVALIFMLISLLKILESEKKQELSVAKNKE